MLTEEDIENVISKEFNMNNLTKQDIIYFRRIAKETSSLCLSKVEKMIDEMINFKGLPKEGAISLHQKEALIILKSKLRGGQQ